MSARDAQEQRGFTLLEVMIALAILASAMVVLLRISSADVRSAHEAKLITIATGLARSKMYDIESELLKDGYQDTDQSINGDFSDEGQPSFTWEALVEKVSLPTLGDMQQGSTSQPAGSSSSSSSSSPPPSGSDPANQDALLALAGGDASGALGAGMVQMFLPMIEPILEQCIRKVTLVVKWKVGSEDKTISVICFFTDPKAIDTAMGVQAGGGATTNPVTNNNTPKTPVVNK